MTYDDTPAVAVKPTLSPEAHNREARKVAIAGLIGTSIEWYDFYLYGSISALVIPELFFPNEKGFLGVLAAFGTFFAGFVSRPLGALIFGHFGDRVGRKATLIATLVIMGTASVLIGSLPSYSTIGILAPILLIFLRLCQGIGIGGEWGGASVLTTEWSPKHKRGLMGSAVQIGVPMGLLWSSVAVTLVLLLPHAQFYAWAWRIPFWVSGALVVLGLVLRMRISESPAFLAEKRQAKDYTNPIREVIKRYPKPILYITFGRLVDQVPFYVFTTFIISYGTGTLDLKESTFTTGSIAMAIVGIITIPIFAHWSDKLGRKRLFMVGCAVVIAYAFPVFMLIETKSPVVIIAAIAFVHIGNSLVYGPEAALFSENFPVEFRYSGTSIGYQLATVIGGGLAPIISSALFAKFGSTIPISMYVIVVTCIAIVAISRLKERPGQELTA